MLTRQGVLVGIAAIALAVAGRIFGILELYVLAAAAGGVLLLALASVVLLRPRVAIARTIHPPRVHVGAVSRVDLRVENTSRRRSPVLRLSDAVSGTAGANLMLSPLPRRGVATAAYQLPTDRRGLLHVGPLDLTVNDPFGLVQRRRRAASTTELVVYPRLDELFAQAATSGNDPRPGTNLAQALGRSSDDFNAIREYVVGDDLRRVHWPSTARHDELMVRQDEVPWFGRTTVLIDVRRPAHTSESFELAVSAGASVLAAAAERGDQIRLVTTAADDTGYGAGDSHLEGILYRLAIATMTDHASLSQAIGRLSQNRDGGSLVVILALAAPIGIDTSLRGTRSRWANVTQVVFEPSSWGSDMAVPAFTGSGARTLRVDEHHSFAEVWNAADAPTKGLFSRAGRFASVKTGHR